MQKEIVVAYVPYDRDKLGPGWCYSLEEKAWVFESGAPAPQVFVLPSFHLSVIDQRRGDGCFIYKIYYHRQLAPIYLTVLFAHIVSDNAPKETYDFARMPVKYEAYVDQGGFAFVPYKDRFTSVGVLKCLVWLRAAPDVVEMEILKGVHPADKQPVGKQWVAQYELDYKNRVVPVLANTDFSCIPANFNGLVPDSVLTRENYINMLLPVIQPLDDSNFLHPDFLGMWDNCTDVLIKRLDDFLIVCATRFWNERCKLNSEPHGADIKLFEDALLSNTLPFLGVLGFLDKRKVASFISRVAYSASPTPRCNFDAQDAIFYARVSRDLELLLSAHAQEFPLNDRVSKSMALYKNRGRAINSVANKIVLCLLSVQNVHLRARLVHFAGPNFLFGFE
jgi:hypothetical protein